MTTHNNQTKNTREPMNSDIDKLLKLVDAYDRWYAGDEGLDQNQFRTQLQDYIKEREVEARINMVKYYDQATDNKDMDWKGLFSDNLQALEYELQQLKDGAG